MESFAPTILPDGLVVNSRDIYKEVAHYSVIPPDKIHQYWHGNPQIPKSGTFLKLMPA
jgi:hypothetical protein